jgi:hypothetical protein
LCNFLISVRQLEQKSLVSHIHGLLTLNQRVPGSSPGAPTNKIKHLTSGTMLDLPRIRDWEEHGKIRRQARAEASE